MFKSLAAIATNTFAESIRQPVYGVIIAAALLLLVFGPALAMFTLDDDNKLLQDTALSTMLVAGLFLAAFTATTVVHGEIENKTVLTVLSKKVSRGAFVTGKFLGVTGAVLMAEVLLGLAVLVIDRNGVMQTASDEHDMVAVTLGVGALALSFLIGMLGNYLYRWRFSSTAVVLATVLGLAVVAMLAVLDPHWQFNPGESHLHWPLLGPMALAMLACVVLTAVAVAAATRLGLVMTLSVCVLIFLLGVMLQPWLQPLTLQSTALGYVARGVLTVLPCMSFFVVTNAIYQGMAVPLAYLVQVSLYALLYVAAVLLFATALFRGREIG